MSRALSVALVDDDAAVLDSLSLYLESQGVAVSAFDNAEAVLAALERAEAFDCIVADVRMPGLSGTELATRVLARAPQIPIVLITGHGDVDMAVAAIKQGVFDFIEKPFDEARLLASINNAVAAPRRARPDSPEQAELRRRFDALSERQRQVMELATVGLSNKEIAQRLSLSIKTVEVHRSWVMERMGARNLAELVRMAVRLG